VLLLLLINLFLITMAVAFHYEMLRALSQLIPRLKLGHRQRVVIGVFGAICAHVAEIVLFGVAFYFMVRYGDFGSLQGNFDGSLMDSIYFSFTNYTTVGYGDIEPLGGIRLVSGIEAITGLSLITWSASFMFMEMTQFWEDENRVLASQATQIAESADD